MKKQSLPLVSVIMPVYNAGDFLPLAIDSILSQTYKNFELIIVDDASTDNSWTIIRAFQKRNPKKITSIRLKENLNAGGDTCANIGLAIAQGKYIARMDADDISNPLRLEKQVAYLESHPRTYLVGSNAYVINRDGQVIGEKTEPLTHESIKKQYFTFHPLIHPSTMFRRMIDGKPFRYKLNYSANNDYYTFFTLLCEGKRYANLPEKLLCYRIHGNNDTFVNMKEKYLNTLKIRLVMCRKYGYRPSPKAALTAAVQTAVVFALPEQLIAQLYFITKGIKTITLPSFPPRAVVSPSS